MTTRDYNVQYLLLAFLITCLLILIAGCFLLILSWWMEHYPFLVLGTSLVLALMFIIGATSLLIYDIIEDRLK